MPHTTHTPQPHDHEAVEPADEIPGIDSYLSAKLGAWTEALGDPDGEGAAVEE